MTTGLGSPLMQEVRNGPTLPYAIARTALRQPDAPAVAQDGAHLSYGEFVDRAARLGAALAGLGLGQGNSVAVILTNRLEYLEIDLGLGLSGMVRVALNARWTLEDFSYAIADSDARAVITEPAFDEVAEELAARHGISWVRLGGPGPGHDYELLLGATSGAVPSPPLRGGDPAWISYTAGTTGRSKGVELSHFALSQVAANLALELGPIDSETSVLLPQPLSHGAGYFALPYLAAGGTVHVMSRWDPEQALKVGAAEGITTLKMVPAMLADILETGLDSPFESLIYGASPIPTAHLEGALDRYGPVLMQIYGQSEAPMTITVLDRADHVRPGAHRASAGRAWRSVVVEVVNPEGIAVPPGELGEVVIAGLHVMDGYRGKPEETAEVLQGGRLWTKDMAYADEQGYVFLQGRRDEMINSGGYNIAPREVEEVLGRHPDVHECVVVSMPSERYGEAVRAVVVAAGDASVTEAQLIDFCKPSLGFRRPRSVVLLDDLPRNAYGKIDRTGLSAAIAHATTGAGT